jgi:predicted  nucleic acid-binding Zn-ribbon protein
VTEGHDALAALLVIQDHDTTLDQLRHRRATLPERAALNDLEDRIAKVDGSLGPARAGRDEVAGRQAALEAEVQRAEDRIAEVEKRLYGGTVSASRELTAMSEEVEHLKARKSSLEDQELEVMEEREPLDADVARLEAERVALSSQADDAADALVKAEAEVDREITAASAEREAAVSSVPPDLLAVYEKLRARLGGVGAARLVGSSCSGCHLVLPATELDRIKKSGPDALVYCDQCGRILVR